MVEAIKGTKMSVAPLKVNPQKEKERAEKLEKFRRETEERRKERERLQKEQEERERQKRQEKKLRRQQQQQQREQAKKERLQQENETHKVEKKEIPKKSQDVENSTKKTDILKTVAAPKVQQISARDFVVRRSVFKCTHDKHKIENLDAMVEIIDSASEIRAVKVNAGYCPDCKIFFIMESTYEKLKRKGIPICRVSDEKSYLKTFSANGMRLAQESILMQYGYNVNQVEGLTRSRRHKILAVLIDLRILSKSEIIGYLDFFISQRQSNSKYGIAISKWEDDREFVEEYRIGEYHQFGVNAIYHR